MQETYSFHYSFNDEENKSVASHSFTVEDGAFLPRILNAFVEFLQRAGFTYVEELKADCGGAEHSSNDLDGFLTKDDSVVVLEDAEYD